MKRLLLFASLGICLATARGALGDEEGKELKDRIRSVSNRMYLKDGRLEFTVFPFSSLSLNDAFFQKIGGGAGLAYHINDYFAVQIMGTYSLNLELENAALAGSKTGTQIPYAGKRTFLVDGNLCWTPIYGKISLVSESVIHFDTYVLAGMGAVGGELLKDSNVGVAASFGLGFRMFFTTWFAVKAELVDLMIFNDKVNAKNSVTARGDVQNQLLFNLGLSFFALEGKQEE